MVGGTWWAVSGGRYNDFFARDCIQSGTLTVRSLMVECLFLPMSFWSTMLLLLFMLLMTVVVVSKYLCYFVMVSAALLFAGE